MTLGENLQRLRKERGLSQEEVAQRLFVSRQSVSKWELDQSEPGVEYLKALSELYAVSLDELAGMPPLPGPVLPEPAPPEEPEPRSEEKRQVSFYRIVFGLGTVLAVLENVLLTLPGGSFHLPFDWLTMLVGLFVRREAVWWVAQVFLWLNLVVAVLSLFVEPLLGAVALVRSGLFLYAFFRREIKGYFHMLK